MGSMFTHLYTLYTCYTHFILGQSYKYVKSLNSTTPEHLHHLVAELQKDGLLKGEIRFHNRDDSTFKARRW
jgi:hypothetical protein